MTQGKFAIVDLDDYYRLCKHKWCAIRMGRTFYAARSIRAKDGKQHQLVMHRWVINVPDSLFVDHINHNGLDNRRANLRPATYAQNIRNRPKFSNRRYGSKFKGVIWHHHHKFWQAQIRVNRKPIFLGSFHNEVEAAKAYDLAAEKYHGDFASLNFPRSRPERRITSRKLLDSTAGNT